MVHFFRRSPRKCPGNVVRWSVGRITSCTHTHTPHTFQITAPHPDRRNSWVSKEDRGEGQQLRLLRYTARCTSQGLHLVRPPTVFISPSLHHVHHRVSGDASVGEELYEPVSTDDSELPNIKVDVPECQHGVESLTLFVALRVMVAEWRHLRSSVAVRGDDITMLSRFSRILMAARPHRSCSHAKWRSMS